jgi:hypothetical protein
LATFYQRSVDGRIIDPISKTKKKWGFFSVENMPSALPARTTGQYRIVTTKELQSNADVESICEIILSLQKGKESSVNQK